MYVYKRNFKMCFFFVEAYLIEKLRAPESTSELHKMYISVHRDQAVLDPCTL